MSKKSKENFWRIFIPALLFLLTLAINLFFFSWGDAPVEYNDTKSYVKVAEEIKNFTLPDLSYRPPVYPAFLVFTGYLGDYLNTALFQTIIGALTIVLIYYIILLFLPSSVYAFTVSLFLSLDLQVLTFQSTILTETLTVFLMMLSVYLHLKFFKPKKWPENVFLIISDLLLVFIKPALIIAPFIFYILKGANILFDKKNSKKRLVPILGAIFLNIAALFLFCSYNSYKSGYFGVSTVANMNNLGKIFQYEFLKKEYTNPPEEVAETLGLFKWGIANYNAYTFQSLLLERGLFNNDKIALINGYLLESNKKDFIIKSLQEVPKVLIDKTYLYAEPSLTQARSVETTIISVYGFLIKSVRIPALLFSIFVLFVLFLKKRFLEANMLAIVLSVIAYVVMATAAFSFTEYVRVRIPVEYLMNMMIFISPVVLMRALKKERIV